MVMQKKKKKQTSIEITFNKIKTIIIQEERIPHGQPLCQNTSGSRGVLNQVVPLAILSLLPHLAKVASLDGHSETPALHNLLDRIGAPALTV